MMWNDGQGYGMFFGPLFMVLILAATIVVIAVLVRWLSAPQPGALFGNQPSLSPRALDMLQERYAKGEINKEEFEERRRVLRS